MADLASMGPEQNEDERLPTVRTIYLGHFRHRYRGQCVCGWSGPERVYIEDARADYAHHADLAMESDMEAARD